MVMARQNLPVMHKHCMGFHLSCLVRYGYMRLELYCKMKVAGFPAVTALHTHINLRIDCIYINT